MSNDAPLDQAPDFDGYLQRAELLADLGRYDDAAVELGYAVALAPGSASVRIVLARVHLAAGRPAEALTAAGFVTAAASGPTDAANPDSESSGLPDRIAGLVVRGLALVDLRRFREAAQVADELLALWPTDAYAQRSAAAILAESRNGQQALNAAWRGVELAPEESQAHLVLSLVSARLGVFDLAERAYREALRLDPGLATARQDTGVARLEQRRYAEALEDVAEAAALPPGQLDSPRVIADGLRTLVLYGAGSSLVASVLAAFLAPGSPTGSRLFAVVAAVIGGLLGWRFAARIPDLFGAILPALSRADRPLALAVYAVVAAPAFLLLYAVVGTPWPLVLAIAITAIAEYIVLLRPVRPS